MNYGLLQSQLTGDEHHFYNTQPVGVSFSYSLPDVYDQGSEPICAACSASAFLQWAHKQNFDPERLFWAAGGTQQGISFKDFLKFLRRENLIYEYGMVHSEQALKTAIMVNGPCLASMTVRDPDKAEFWDGEVSIANHGVAVTGWNEKGYIIRNSWGENWGNKGYTILPDIRFMEFKELWTMIA